MERFDMWPDMTYPPQMQHFFFHFAAMDRMDLVITVRQWLLELEFGEDIT